MTYEFRNTIPPERHENAYFINNNARTARGWWRNAWVGKDNWRNMVNTRLIAAAILLLSLAGCAGTWEVAYDDPPGQDVTKTWRVVDVVARRAHRHFGNLGGEHPTEVARQRQGEVAVAAVEFEQVSG